MVWGNFKTPKAYSAHGMDVGNHNSKRYKEVQRKKQKKSLLQGLF
jgi:hypothetical protein